MVAPSSIKEEGHEQDQQADAPLAVSDSSSAQRAAEPQQGQAVPDRARPQAGATTAPPAVESKPEGGAKQPWFAGAFAALGKLFKGALPARDAAVEVQVPVQQELQEAEEEEDEEAESEVAEPPRSLMSAGQEQEQRQEQQEQQGQSKDVQQLPLPVAAPTDKVEEDAERREMIASFPLWAREVQADQAVSAAAGCIAECTPLVVITQLKALYAAAATVPTWGYQMYGLTT